MSSIETVAPEHRQTLLAVAEASIRHGLSHGTPLPVQASDFAEILRCVRATFVTLTRNGSLRGCIGTLAAERPLVEDVAWHAFAAAFEDPRFPRLREAELGGLAIDISILSPAQPLPVSSEADLLSQLRVGTDGLILREGGYRATFLPSVWESLPEPREFLHHLKLKAGLAPDHWSETIRFERYTTFSFGTESVEESAAGNAGTCSN